MSQFSLSVWPPWALMWTMAISIYIGCKWLTWQRATVRDVPAWKHAAYLLAWPGLDATTFLGAASSGCLRCRSIEWIAAAARLTFGVVLLFAVPRMAPPEHPYVVGWIGMVGLVLILHFGIFHLLSCSWRRIGVQARPLMDRPFASTSVSEFWGRWNTAFRDLTYRFLFRPCASRFGARWGIVVGFLFSGAVLHRQMYWVYAGYVVLSIVAFAAMSVFHSRELASAAAWRTGSARTSRSPGESGLGSSSSST